MAKSNNMNSKVFLTNLLELSFAAAVSMDQTTITSEHLLYSIMQSVSIGNYFTHKGVDVKSLLTELRGYIKSQSHLLKNQIPSNDPNIMHGQMTREVTNVLDNSQRRAIKDGREIDVSDILMTILENSKSYGSYYLSKYGVSEDIIRDLRKNGDEHQPVGIGADEKKQFSDNALTEFCTNLNEKMKTSLVDPLIGRDKELFTIAHTLSKRKKCNVLLVGDPGVGKSMIVDGLAQRINAGNVPAPLKDKVIFSLDVGSVLAGCRYRGDFEEKIKGILAEIVSNPKAILFIDEAQAMDAGDKSGSQGLGFSSMLKPELSRGAIKVIGATTWEGYRTTFEKDTALMRRFRTVTVDEPSSAETIEILKGGRASMQEFHNCTIEDSAIEAAVELTVKYQNDKRLPDKAIDALDSACARKQVVESDSRVINRASIIEEITEATGIKVKSETNNEDAAKQILSIGDRLNSRIFHQETAIEKVAQILIISQAGLKNPKKPIGSLLFVGPSGVGKTFTAEELAKDMGMTFLKYDMSEFQEKHAVARLIGAPPGYVGFGDGGTGEGQLVNDLIKNPNSVVLFDEVEKAHPDTFNVFLQLLDEGTLTGTTGKVANCRNCIIIMSSNLGTKEGSKANLGFDLRKTGKSASAKAVDGFFLTELRGRMTGVVEFSPLDDLAYRRIVTERINDMSKLIHNRKVRLVAKEPLVSHILELNTSGEYGARKIAGIVENIISYPLSVELLKGNIPNNSTISLDWVNDALVIDPHTDNDLVEQPVV